MKKNLIGIVIIAVVVAVIGVAAAVHFWFEAPGIRLLGDDLHIEVNQIGYVIDSRTGKVTGQTPVNAKGSTSRHDSELFDGDLTVLGYQNTETGTIDTTMAIEATDSGFYLIRVLENCTHKETINKVEQNVEHLCDYYYTYYVYPENDDFLVILVENFEETTPLYVVCADSEEAALEDYRWFMENKPE